MANDFKAFAAAGGANVYTQAQYLALTSGNYIANGNLSGIADSKAVNKVARQASIMAAVLAQFIVDKTGLDAIDDGTTATLLANLKGAINASGRVQRFISSGSLTVPSGVTTIYASGCAGGGGGGGSAAAGTPLGTGGGGGGGGAGQPAIRLPFTVTPGQVIAVTIGGSGSPGAAGTGGNGGVGGNGGNTVLGALLTLTGGTGGGGGFNSSTAPAGGLGGTGFPTGSDGSDGNPTTPNAGACFGGGGGAGPYGGGAPLKRSTNAVGQNGGDAAGFGGGGGGGSGAYNQASVPGRVGGTGGPGILIIEW